jgi:RimJ/RimL family protein N-acetyltransferase
VLETQRLGLRRLAADDAAFILELLNEPSFLRWIGDKGVRTCEDACRYLESGPLAMYAKHGFGLLAVESREGGAAMGMCGLLKRDALELPDLGFAFLPRCWSRGYAREAAQGVLAHGRASLGIRRVLAITDPDNQPSIRLLESIGFRFERLLRMPGDAHDVRLFASEP